MDSPQTPSQIRAYIDACKDWLISAGEGDVEEEEVYQPAIFDQVTPVQMQNISVVPEYVYSINAFDCFNCNTHTQVSKGTIVNANPFARSSCVMLCEKCSCF